VKVFVVRHSIPDDGDGDPWEPENDDPGLTDKGKELVESLAKWMQDADEIPAIIYASPTQRTQETAEILRDKLEIMPRVVTDIGIGPHMSIRGLVRQVAEDKSIVRPLIVSHHESIEHGLRELNRDPWVHLDMFAQGEMRIYKVDREDARWDEHNRVLPSDLGGEDHY